MPNLNKEYLHMFPSSHPATKRSRDSTKVNFIIALLARTPADFICAKTMSTVTIWKYVIIWSIIQCKDQRTKYLTDVWSHTHTHVCALMCVHECDNFFIQKFFYFLWIIYFFRNYFDDVISCLTVIKEKVSMFNCSQRKRV